METKISKATKLKSKIKDLNLSIMILEKHSKPGCNVLDGYRQQLKQAQKQLVLSSQSL